ncbi:hypothetical protein KY290_013489 [Solanum tuberosum]|uniref:Uncharacterized protein n=1 Tax=Solanum tuberosum TaxID=4113 RepID=A0ABQ7VM44_SOLTU|nr:hypothetical protein KY289_013608 [Solanum tuberosum]KAH0716912.1 hypothetical protein KY285_012943 [Solanum tuberosum]KAH0769508.1 hypothetical protein KY290_013489 [Solanum tuberosum]
MVPRGPRPGGPPGWGPPLGPGGPPMPGPGGPPRLGPPQSPGGPPMAGPCDFFSSFCNPIGSCLSFFLLLLVVTRLFWSPNGFTWPSKTLWTSPP